MYNKKVWANLKRKMSAYIVYFSNFNVRAFELLGIMTCDESPRNDSHDSLERR